MVPPGGVGTLTSPHPGSHMFCTWGPGGQLPATAGPTWGPDFASGVPGAEELPAAARPTLDHIF